MNRLILSTMDRVLLALIALALPFFQLSCKEPPTIELSVPSIDVEGLSESELHEGIRAFYDTVYGVKQIEIRVASERIKTEQNQKAFKVLYDDNLRGDVIRVNVITGQVVECTSNGGGNGYSQLIEAKNPEKYAAYLAYQEKKKQRRVESDARQVKSETEYREKLKDPEFRASAMAMRETMENPENLTKEEKERLENWRGERRKKYEAELNDTERKEWEEYVAWKPEYARVTEVEILERIKPVLDYYNLTLNKERCLYQYNLNVPIVNIRYELEHEGVVYQHAALLIGLDLYSGYVHYIDFKPIGEIPIEQVASPVSKADAVKVAAVVMRDNEAYFEFSSRSQTIDYEFSDRMDDIIPVIIRPAQYSSIPRDKKAYVANLPREPRYCWRVPFNCYMEKEMREVGKRPYLRPEYIFVDQETGKVVNGWVGPLEDR